MNYGLFILFLVFIFKTREPCDLVTITTRFKIQLAKLSFGVQSEKGFWLWFAQTSCWLALCLLKHVHRNAIFTSKC